MTGRPEFRIPPVPALEYQVGGSPSRHNNPPVNMTLVTGIERAERVASTYFNEKGYPGIRFLGVDIVWAFRDPAVREAEYLAILRDYAPEAVKRNEGREPLVLKVMDR